VTLAFDPHDYYGYPEQIDALAIRLSKLAAKVQNGSDAVNTAIENMGFEGPKAQEIRKRQQERRRTAQGIVERLQELSWTTFQASDLARQKLYELELAEQRMRDAMYPEP
jgi:hypothetical protein